MQLEVRKYLYDIKQAADLLGEFTAGKQFSDYHENSMLRAAVERKFEIIGEALSKLSKVDPAIASGIGEHARIIAFRNILIHGYAEIDDRLVWEGRNAVRLRPGTTSESDDSDAGACEHSSLFYWWDSFREDAFTSRARSPSRFATPVP